MIRRLGTLARDVNPARSFFGPMFYKEMLVTGRRKSTYWIRFGAIAVMTLILGVTFFNISSELAGARSVAARMTILSSVAPGVAVVVGLSLCALLPILGGVFGCQLVSEEREARTLPSVLATPMTPWRILAGKATARAIQLLIIALSALPLLLAVRVFGGVEARLILVSLLIATCAALFTLACSGWLSLRSNRAWTCLNNALGILLLLCFLPYIPSIVAQIPQLGNPRLFGWDDYTLVFLANHFSPAGGLFVLNAPFFEMPPPPAWQHWWPLPSESFWITNCAWLLLLAAFFLLGTARSLMKYSVGKKRERVKRRKKRKRSAEQAEAGVASSTARADRGSSRIVRGNPVLWREVRQSMFGKSLAFKVIGGLAILALLALLYVNADELGPAVHALLIFPTTIFAFLSALAAATGSITSERSQRTLDTLFTTPMSARSLAIGKTLGAMPKPMLIAGLGLLHVLAFVLITIGFPIDDDLTISPLMLVHLPLIVLSTGFMLCASGFFFGTIMKRGISATVLNLLLWAGFWLIIPLMLSFLAFALFSGDDPFIMKAIFVINPVAMLATAFEGSIDTGWNNGYRYPWNGDDISPAAFTFQLVVFAAAAIAVGVGFLEAARARLKRIALRTR